MDPSFKVPGYGDHMQRSMQRTPDFGPRIGPSGELAISAKAGHRRLLPGQSVCVCPSVAAHNAHQAQAKAQHERQSHWPHIDGVSTTALAAATAAAAANGRAMTGWAAVAAKKGVDGSELDPIYEQLNKACSIVLGEVCSGTSAGNVVLRRKRLVLH
eukprot:1162017-Pelagomonas_calceolata.AAC.1